MLAGGDQLDLDVDLLLRFHRFPDCTTRRPCRQGRSAMSAVLPAPIPDNELVPWWEWQEGKRPPGWDGESVSAPPRAEDARRADQHSWSEQDVVALGGVEP